MAQAGRNNQSGDYRYGYNGKEEVKTNSSTQNKFCINDKDMYKYSFSDPNCL